MRSFGILCFEIELHGYLTLRGETSLRRLKEVRQERIHEDYAYFLLLLKDVDGRLINEWSQQLLTVKGRKVYIDFRESC